MKTEYFLKKEIEKYKLLRANELENGNDENFEKYCKTILITQNKLFKLQEIKGVIK